MVRSIYQAYREAYGGLPREVWVLSAALFINRCGSMVLAFLTLYLTTKLGFKITEASAIFSVYGLGSILGAYAGGRLVEPLGAVRVQIMSLIVAAPIFVVVPWFTSWWGVAASIFILSAVSESIRPANNVAVSRFTPPDRQTRAYGLQRMALNLGLSVGPATGGLLAGIDFALLFYVDGLTSLLGGLFLLRQFGFRKHVEGDEPVPARPVGKSNPERDRLSPLSDMPFICFLGLTMTVALVFFQFHATYPKYLEEQYGLGKPWIGLLFAVNTIIIVVFEMLLVNFVSSFRLLRMVGWGCFFACIGFGILPISVAFSFAVFSMTIITLGEMLMFPLATGFVAKRSTGRDQGMYMSWFAMTFSLAAVIAPILGGYLYSLDRHLFWYLSVGLGCLGLLGFYRLDATINATTETVAADVDTGGTSVAGNVAEIGTDEASPEHSSRAAATCECRSTLSAET